jgi:hypothetical protein
MMFIQIQQVGRGTGRGRRGVARRLGALSILPIAVLTFSTAPAFAAAIASQRSVSATGACNETSTKVGGFQAFVYCGPATATFTVGGKTYSFKNGTCETVKLLKIPFALSLGEQTSNKTGQIPSSNNGKPYLYFQFTPGVSDTAISDVYYGGKDISNGGLISLKGTLGANGSSKGTFKSTEPEGGKMLPFSGSWNCHGVFNKNGS